MTVGRSKAVIFQQITSDSDSFLLDLSFQAASQIMSTPVYDAIKLMKDISQNFPIKARYVKLYWCDYKQVSFH